MKCLKCLAPVQIQPWKPAAGLEPLLRKYKCSKYEEMTYERTGRILKAAKARPEKLVREVQE